MSAKKLANLETLVNSKLINFKTKRSFFLQFTHIRRGMQPETPTAMGHLFLRMTKDALKRFFGRWPL